MAQVAVCGSRIQVAAWGRPSRIFRSVCQIVLFFYALIPSLPHKNPKRTSQCSIYIFNKRRDKKLGPPDVAAEKEAMQDKTEYENKVSLIAT
jgi:hypothetical protein